jgi:hypothetical protein
VLTELSVIAFLMTLDPHTQFDQAVLDKIEQSPTGAVPYTPAYQDALNRLRTSHQVYSSADHKGGYVTVRSLASLPLFTANNLEAFLAGQESETELESDDQVFQRYVDSLPPAVKTKAEAARALVVAKRHHHRSKHGGAVVSEPAHSLLLVPGAGPHPGLAGNYLYGSVREIAGNEAGATWEIQLHDAEDGSAVCELASRAEALEKLQEITASAPFLLSELTELGFRLN